ncbi:thymidylate kinase [Burkholderia pseudomallei]|nr:thymidylate kinase [Burkholderia pseudomallei]
MEIEFDGDRCWASRRRNVRTAADADGPACAARWRMRPPAAAGSARRRLRGPRCRPRPFAVGHRAPALASARRVPSRCESPRRRPRVCRRTAGFRPRRATTKHPMRRPRASPRGNEPPFQRRPLMRRRGTPFPCYRRSGRPARASPAAPPHRQMRRRAGGEPRRSCPGRCGRMRNKRRRRARTGVDLSQAPRRARREPDRNGGSPIRRPS